MTKYVLLAQDSEHLPPVAILNGRPSFLLVTSSPRNEGVNTGEFDPKNIADLSLEENKHQFGSRFIPKEVGLTIRRQIPKVTQQSTCAQQAVGIFLD